MKAIILGGPGRSGTSLIRDWFTASPDAVSFGKTEGKFFVEAYGLLDLYRAFVTDYSFSRASVALHEFRVLMTVHLTDAEYSGMPAITDCLPEHRRPEYHRIANAFADSLCAGTVPVWHSDETFFGKARGLVAALIDLIADGRGAGRCFIEKTPHNALNPWIFGQIFDRPSFVWVIRDPRAIVYSTSKMPDWGPHTTGEAITYVRQVLSRYLRMRDAFGGYEVRLEDLGRDHDAVVAGMEEHCDFAIRSDANAYDEDIVNDWKNYLSGAPLRHVEQELAYEIAKLGY